MAVGAAPPTDLDKSPLDPPKSTFWTQMALLGPNGTFSEWIRPPFWPCFKNGKLNLRSPQPAIQSQLLHKYIEDNNISHKIKVIKNNKNYRQGYSRYIAFKDCGDDEICCLLDGDDWLYNNHVLTKLNDLYNNNDILVSYGSYIRYENGKVSIPPLFTSVLF